MLSAKNYGPGDDLEFMQKPELWPRWPLLPVKRYVSGEQWPQLGILLAVEDCERTVFIGNVFSCKSVDDILDNATECCKYESYEKLLQDGWVVD